MKKEFENKNLEITNNGDLVVKGTEIGNFVRCPVATSNTVKTCNEHCAWFHFSTIGKKGDVVKTGNCKQHIIGYFE
jgi:hypothetical protein